MQEFLAIKIKSESLPFGNSLISKQFPGRMSFPADLPGRMAAKSLTHALFSLAMADVSRSNISGSNTQP
jgi:hypothetical protein